MSVLAKKTPLNRVMVIGLDCGTLDLIEPWARAGYLPNLARLITGGSYGILESTLPTISPAAWTSFMTGKNPGKHGVYDFFRRREQSYQTVIVRNNLPALGTIFRQISEAGFRVGVVNVPMTYPPEPVNGFMISGLGAPDNHKYTYPPELVYPLKEKGYTINNPAFKPEQADEFLTRLMKDTDIRAEVTLELLGQEAWDFFMVVFRDIDTIQAFYWHYMDETHPLYNPAEAAKFGDAVLIYHQQIDGIIGRMLATFGEGIVLVMSDHGGGPLHKEVHVNNWLAQEGFLTFKKRKNTKDGYLSLLRRLGLTRENITHSLGWPTVDWLKSHLPLSARTWIPWENPGLVEMIDWTHTKAFSFGHIGQIFVNLKGREPQGIVSPGEEYQRVVAEIVTKLEQLTDPETGERVVTGIYLKDQLYQGPYTDLGPDINVVFCDMRYLVHIGTEFGYGGIFGPPVHYETGTHRLAGMMIACGQPIQNSLKTSQSYSIMDMAPTILHLMGLPIPDDVDGCVIQEILKEDFRLSHPVTSIKPSNHGLELSPWSPEDEQEVTRRLKDLGYLG